MTGPAARSTGQQGAFPGKTAGPIADAEGNITLPWFRLLLLLWQRVGGSGVTNQNFYYVDATGGIPVLVTPTGTSGGSIPTSGGTGGPAQPQAPAISPFVFAAAQAGTLVVDAGKVELSRDGGATWYGTGFAGGAVPLLATDRCRVTWLAGDPPIVVFLPGA